MKRQSTAVIEDAPLPDVSQLPPVRDSGVSRSRGKKLLNKEISIIMLLMAAQTISGMVNLQDKVLSTELIAESHTFQDRPSLHEKLTFASSFYSSASSLDQMPYVAPSEGISSSSAHSDASEATDEDHEEEEDEVRAARLASQLTTPRRTNRLFAEDEDVWENIFSFLPWEAALQARGVSKVHFRASLPRATVTRMPHSKLAAVFIPCLEDLDGDEMAVEAELAPQPGASAAGGQRLFLGQLRRTGTVPMVRWLVNTVFNAPPGALVSVENRRNTHTQRGKGCAWPTINDAATVERMLAAHHRLFFDAVDGVEGVWLVPEGQEAALQAEIALRGDGASTHQKHMPRGTVVVETPAIPTIKVKAAAPKEETEEAAPSETGATASVDARTPTPETEAVVAAEVVAAKAAVVLDAAVTQEETTARFDCVVREGYLPYRVPGVDFVQPGVYRLNPYTAMM